MGSIDLTASVESFYQAVDEKQSVELFQEIMAFQLPKLEGELWELIELIVHKLQLNYRYFTLMNVREKENFVESGEYMRVMAVELGCLLPLKRTIDYSTKPVILDLDILPLYFDLDLHNIRPYFMSIKLTENLYLACSDSILPDFKPDVWNLLALRMYVLILQQEVPRQYIGYLKDLFVGGLDVEAEVLHECKSAYFQVAVKMNSLEQAQALVAVLWDRDIIAQRQRDYVVFTFKPFHTIEEVKRVVEVVNIKLPVIYELF